VLKRTVELTPSHVGLGTLHAYGALTLIGDALCRMRTEGAAGGAQRSGASGPCVEMHEEGTGRVPFAAKGIEIFACSCSEDRSRRRTPDRSAPETGGIGMKSTAHSVCEAVLAIANRKTPALTEVRREQRLVEDFGLASLDRAGVVAAPEMSLGVDPFAEDVAITSFRTVNDRCVAKS
jgi:hypothetical protein